MDRRHFLMSAAVSGTGLSRLAHADAFPAKPIRLLNGFGPGSAADVVSRLIAPHMQEVLGQSIIVDTIQGAGGNVVAQTVARARPDGHTLLLAVNNTFGSNAYLLPSQFDPLTAFAPIMPVVNMGAVVLAGPASPAQNWRGVVEASRRDVVTYGTPGVGTPQHLVGEMLRERINGKLVHVPYKGGAVAANDLLAGQIALGILGYAPSAGFIQAGRLKPLAACGSQRLSALPDVPTLSELEPGLTLGTWGGLFAPAGTPADICRVIAGAVDKGLRDRSVISQLTVAGLDRIEGGADELRRMVKTEHTESGAVIQRLNIRL